MLKLFSVMLAAVSGISNLNVSHGQDRVRVHYFRKTEPVRVIHCRLLGPERSLDILKLMPMRVLRRRAPGLKDFHQQLLRSRPSEIPGFRLVIDSDRILFRQRRATDFLRVPVPVILFQGLLDLPDTGAERAVWTAGIVP